MKLRLIATAAILATLGLSSAFAVGTHEDREAIMKKVGGATGALAAIAKGEKPYDAEAIKTALSTISENAKAFPDQFPPGSETGDKAASPKIWETFDDFKAKSLKLSADADAVLAQLPADAAGVGAALKTLGANCGGCHQVYRIKE
ncbi:cytochrome c [Rhizobium sp. LjRoot30]|uniref:c-type cytochrome n=1 Tax=Rhizobium sp. LjRoot30 TaxID=3342320 RepID=UPI003ECD56D3